MTGPYDNKQWSVNDFKRYYSGSMEEAERHALEKAALDDPFLDDALEGFSFSANPVEDVADLRRRLQPEQENQLRVVWFKPKSVRLLKFAAALILFGGFAWFIYSGKNKQPVELAANKKPADIQQSTSPDTSGILSDDASPDQLAGVKLKKDVALPVAKPRQEKKSPDYSDAVKTVGQLEKVNGTTANSESKILKEVLPPAGSFKKMENAQALNNTSGLVLPAANNLIYGTVVNIQGKPIPYATVNISSLNAQVAADGKGNFSFKTKGDAVVVTADVNALGYEKANIPLTAGNNNSNKVVLQESGNALSEVVVVGYGTTKKSVAPLAAVPQKVQSAPIDDYRVILKNGKPLESWEEFNKSVREQIKQNKVTDTAGEVILSFDLDNNGAAQNISIKKKLCASCDEQAKRMLENAPAMRRVKRGKKVEAVVRF